MIKLAKPYIPEESIRYVTEVLRSGNLVQGKFVQDLEQELQQYLGVKNALLVANGTAALHLALVALGVCAGDEVIVPAFTFPATANVVELVGAKTVLVDVRLDDFCIDVDLIEKAITSKTKAIIPVHEFGQPAQMEAIMDIARKYDLHVIEDAACALGAEYKGVKIGSFGVFGCFSLHPRKAITSGEGGIVVTNNDELAEKIRTLRNHGIYSHDGCTDFIAAGFNYRLTDFQAAMCLPQFRVLDQLINKRISQASLYRSGLEFSGIILPKEFKERKTTFQTYHILLDSYEKRNHLITYLKENGIETNYGAQALNTLSYYSRKYSYKKADCPNAVIANQRGLALPLGEHLTDDEISYVISKLL